MKVVLQRVSRAEVRVDGRRVAAIGRGFLLLVGVGREDRFADADALAAKIAGLRVFEDDAGKMNVSLQEAGGGILAVPQFTLLGRTRKGRRPDFTAAAPPDEARDVFERFQSRLAGAGVPVQTGAFREHMQVELLNDGPVTLILDSSEYRG